MATAGQQETAADDSKTPADLEAGNRTSNEEGGTQPTDVRGASASAGEQTQTAHAEHKRMKAPPPKFPPKPKVSHADLPGPAVKEASAKELEARRARAKAVNAAAAAARSALPAQRERAVNEAAAAAFRVLAKPDATAAADEQGSTTSEAGAASDAAAPEAQGQNRAQTQSAQLGPPSGTKQAASYEPPPWSGIPEGVDWALETIRSGTSLGNEPMSSQPFYTFGRTPNNDVVVKHPSSSRLHAVLQFNGETGDAFLYDANSAHGTFLNRRRIKPGIHVPLRVGDMIKLGQSSRDYVVMGPDDRMPVEGASKAQRLEERLLKAREKRRAADADVSAAQMEAALAAGGVVSWGFGEDATEEGDPDGPFVDWRTYSETKGLTDKQEKSAAKIRRKEATVHNLTVETDRIRAKGANGELTAGQAATLARNERTIDILKEEIDDMDEALNESVQDSISGKRRAAKEAKDARRATAAKRKKALDEDDVSGSSDDDEFYDRTTVGGAAAAAGPDLKRARRAAARAMEPGTLFAKTEALSARVAELERALAAQGIGGSEDAEGGSAQDARNLEEAQPQGRSPTAQGGTSGGPPAQQSDAAETLESAFGADDEADAPRRPLPGVESDVAPTVGAVGHVSSVVPGHRQVAQHDGGATTAGGEGDALDAFMNDMAEHIEADKAGSLRRDLEAAKAELEATRAQLRVADPDGFFVAGSAAARAATAKAAAAARLEGQRREARERQRLATLARKKQEAELAARTAAEMEETEEEPPLSSAPAAAGPAADRGPGPGLEIRGKRAAAPAAAPATAPAAVLAPAKPSDAGGAGGNLQVVQQSRETSRPGGRDSSGQESPPALTSGDLRPGDVSEAAAAPPSSGLEVRPAKKAKTRPAASGRGPKDGGGGLLSRAEVATLAASQRATQGPPVDVDSDLDALARARLGAAASSKDEEAGVGWQPPEQQKGDGRTALNDKFGY